MTATQADQQADFEQIVTRIARRAADNASRGGADLACQLALAQESLEGAAAALADRDRQLADLDAELARAHQTTGGLQQRVQELEAELAAASTSDVDDDDVPGPDEAAPTD